MGDVVSLQKKTLRVEGISKAEAIENAVLQFIEALEQCKAKPKLVVDNTKTED